MFIKKDAVRAIAESVPFIFVPDGNSTASEAEIKEALAFFLSKIGHGGLIDIIAYCVMELYNNAEKANLKRRYFLMNGLDVSSPADYERGMRSFRKEALENRPPSAGELKDFGLRTCIALQVYNSGLRVSVRNNSVPTPQERAKIEERIRRSFAFSSLEEALDSIDTTEGAGLGLIIIALALKKLGLGNDAFLVRADNGETAMELVLPAPGDWQNQFKELSERIIDYIKRLPDLPENIRRVQEMIGDKNASLSSIGKLIAEDPAMSAATLKMANSAAYGAKSKTSDIVEAVMRVGMRGVNLVLLACGAERVLGQKTEFIRDLWARSHRTAHYARAIAKTKAGLRSAQDDAYAGGLLIEIGTIILGAVHAEAERKIRAYCDRRGIPPSALEQMLSGLNSSEIGALAAEKWRFPPSLVEAIRYRHTPGKASVQHRDIAETVYVADFIAKYADSPAVPFSGYDGAVLARFGITDEASFRSVRDRLAQEIA